MPQAIGIRREDSKQHGESRVAITPGLAGKLIAEGCRIILQSGLDPVTGEGKRIFGDEQYLLAGAEIGEDLSQANVVIGLKEISPDLIQNDKTYVLFSHTHKGQLKNRPMLRQFVRQKSTVIDYELIRDDSGRRLVTAFTYFAGYAGMIDTLWTYGRRLLLEGHANPFSGIFQSAEFSNLEVSIAQVKTAGKEIAANGTPPELPPLIICFLGTGKTSQGARDIFNLLPGEQIKPGQIADVMQSGSRMKVYHMVLEIDEMFRLIAGSGISPAVYDIWPREEKMKMYFSRPGEFESNLDTVLPGISILVNCTLWSPDFPRTLPKTLMQKVWQTGTPLRVIGDISCDEEGSIGFSHQTWIDNPVFIYDPETDVSTEGWNGKGVAVMAVSNLPCEFPADSSVDFSKDFGEFASAIGHANFETRLEKSGLPDEIKRAIILWKGEFTPEFSYMKKFLSD